MNDGDKSLVVQDELFISIAERNMKDIVPLYYEMSKAEATEINSDHIYESLIAAFKANIGEISNNITKIWNSSEIDVDVVKWLCMENNFTIDYAKTLFMPTRPSEINERINTNIKSKLPHFFVYAKNKEDKNVNKIDYSLTVDKLEKIIKDNRIKFEAVAGKFDYTVLTSKLKFKNDDEITKRFVELNRNKRWLVKKEDFKSNEKMYVYQLIKKELLEINPDIDHVVNVLVKFCFSDDRFDKQDKETLWWCFGDIIVRNIENNLRDTIQCECCGIRIKAYNTKKYCDKCADEKERIRKRNWKRNQKKR